MPKHLCACSSHESMWGLLGRERGKRNNACYWPINSVQVHMKVLWEGAFFFILLRIQSAVMCSCNVFNCLNQKTHPQASLFFQRWNVTPLFSCITCLSSPTHLSLHNFLFCAYKYHRGDGAFHCWWPLRFTSQSKKTFPDILTQSSCMHFIVSFLTCWDTWCLPISVPLVWLNHTHTPGNAWSTSFTESTPVKLKFVKAYWRYSAVHVSFYKFVSSTGAGAKVCVRTRSRQTLHVSLRSIQWSLRYFSLNQSARLTDHQCCPYRPTVQNSAWEGLKNTKR